jgi:hypothetical protein
MRARRSALYAVAALIVAGSILAQEKPNAPWSDEAFWRFLTYYYQEPRPELVTSAISYMQQDGVPHRREQFAPLLGFFAEVFASNEGRLPGWKTEVAKTTGDANRVLALALQYAQNLALITQFDPEKPDPGRNDMCWGAYFASGKQQYVGALVERLAYLSERRSYMLFITAGTAQWSLFSNARQHPCVKKLLDLALLTAPPAVKKAIGDALSESPGEIKESMLQVVRMQREKKVW